MRFEVIVLRSLGLSLALLAGCSTASYRGATPSSRTFSESPAIKDYYVGMNFNWALENQTSYHRASPTDAPVALAAPETTGSAQSSVDSGSEEN